MNVFKLRVDKKFTNDKIKILYNTSSIPKGLSAYLVDESGKMHLVYWAPHTSVGFPATDKTNKKVKSFIDSKVQEWLVGQEQEDLAHDEKIKTEERKLKSLVDNF